jgi:hypothetical protein
MKKRTTTIICLLLILAITTGCGTFGRGRGEPPVSAEFVATGTEGIVMQFVQDQPPMKVYTQSALTFLVEIRNRGTYTVPSAAFYLTGYDPSLLRIMPPAFMLPQPLEGKSPFNPEGGYTTATFEADASGVVLPQSMPNYKPTLMLTACYPYQTIATPLICVDSNPLDTTTDKACRVQKVYATESQGAPVAVESIEAEARPNGMYFRIHIANTAGGTEQASGTVFNMNSMGSCPGGLQYRDLNVLTYTTIAISTQQLDCEPKNREIRLVNDRATIFCKYINLPKVPAFQTPLEIRLQYGYKSSISKIVEIENMNFQR